MSLNNGLSNTINVSISDSSKSVTVISQTGDTSGTTGTAFSSSFKAYVNGVEYPSTWSYSATPPPGLSFSQSDFSSPTNIHYLEHLQQQERIPEL
jgi:hypothetical protein